MDKLKIKLINDIARKVYAANLEFENHLGELLTFLKRNVDKKFDLVLNGKLFKFNSVTAKEKFVEGLSVIKIFETTAKKILNDKERLEVEVKEIEKLKVQVAAERTALNFRVIAWKDRLIELEDACEILRAELIKPNENEK